MSDDLQQSLAPFTGAKGAALRDALEAYLKENPDEVGGQEPPEPVASVWVLMSRNPSLFEQKDVKSRQAAYRVDRKVVWTDTFSGLFRLLSRLEAG